MAKLVVVLSALLALSTLSGCMMSGGPQVVGSGRPATQEYDLSGFTKVDVGSAFEVEIAAADDYAVAVTVDDNLVEYLEVLVDGDTLRIGLKPRLGLGLRNMTLRARIAMPNIEGIDLSGATRGRVSGFGRSELIEVDVSGASQLRGELSANEMRIEASGASRVELIGATGPLEAKASGASELRLQDLSSDDTRVEVSGASTIIVNATGALTGEASGASTVRYKGTPASVNVESSGASTVRPQ